MCRASANMGTSCTMNLDRIWQVLVAFIAAGLVALGHGGSCRTLRGMLGVDDLWWFLSAGGRVKYEYNFSRDRRPEPSQVHYAHRPFIDSMSVYLICISCACAHVLMLLYFICFQKLLKYLCGDPTIDVQFWGPHTSRERDTRTYPFSCSLIWVRSGHLKNSER